MNQKYLQNVSLSGLRMMTAVVLMMMSMACTDSLPPSAPQPSQGELLAVLEPDFLGTTMAIDDTLTMTVTPRNVFGEAIDLADGPAVTYTSADASKVAVDSNGVIHAIANTALRTVNITASWTYHGVTRTATTAVAVTDTRLPITGIELISLDSTRIGFCNVCFKVFAGVRGILRDGGYTAAVVAPITTKADALFLNLGLFLQDTVNVTLIVNSNQIGDFWVVAKGLIYGVPVADSLKYTGLYPAIATITVDQEEQSNALISLNANTQNLVQPCATINFKNTASIPIDIVFDDPAKVARCSPTDVTGNVLNLGVNQTAVRKIPAIDTVTWTARHTDDGTVFPNVSGRIITKNP